MYPTLNTYGHMYGIDPLLTSDDYVNNMDLLYMELWICQQYGIKLQIDWSTWQALAMWLG